MHGLGIPTLTEPAERVFNEAAGGRVQPSRSMLRRSVNVERCKDMQMMATIKRVNSTGLLGCQRSDCSSKAQRRPSARACIDWGLRNRVCA